MNENKTKTKTKNPNDGDILWVYDRILGRALMCVVMGINSEDGWISVRRYSDIKAVGEKMSYPMESFDRSKKETINREIVRLLNLS